MSQATANRAAREWWEKYQRDNTPEITGWRFYLPAPWGMSVLPPDNWPFEKE